MKRFLPLAAVAAVLSLPESGGLDRLEPEVPDVLRAQKFELVDDTGKVRMELRMDDNEPVAALKDEKGRDRVLIVHNPEATGLFIRDADETTRIGVAQFPHGGGIALHGPDSKGAAVFVLMNDRPRLTTYDSDGMVTNQWPSQREDVINKSPEKQE